MAKERSPNYPGLSLDVAIQGVRKVYEKERRSAVPTEAVAKALGHESLSGPALVKIGALRQYGLLEEVSRGKARVSEDALAIVLRKPEDTEYWIAVREVALRPPLFAELFEGYTHSSDDTLRYHLIKERGFSEEGATKVIKTFRGTISFAKLDDESYNVPQESRTVETPGPLEAPSDGSWPIPNGAGGKGKMAFNWLLPGGVKAQIAFDGNMPTPKAIDRLIDYLGFMKDDLKEEDPTKVGDSSG